mmetsp:Transcript_18817/g.56860  ORF Transcript_18817/g.56860 Transcript_18817/m.56860 type:complete len:316 (+) Transcript_18817:435-1382(+)|eukprot:CAMPEP_0206151812 /NCGR_PEP_ID=MMETSP1473-20131121/39006_1 /ASSEMBLY_ACC=CAM_ASM_001109 /TAXON_ID=1461547 /ORGANISM="Stichococcus sp, Strain RCC1054" /LENGTH=315 /DNA_ID=CAMNT_0053549361 /DNA_START=996 /DNA_END=1943 /DNA_ORIENTATION=-
MGAYQVEHRISGRMDGQEELQTGQPQGALQRVRTALQRTSSKRLDMERPVSPPARLATTATLQTPSNTPTAGRGLIPGIPGRRSMTGRGSVSGELTSADEDDWGCHPAQMHTAGKPDKGPHRGFMQKALSAVKGRLDGKHSRKASVDAGHAEAPVLHTTKRQNSARESSFADSDAVYGSLDDMSTFAGETRAGEPVGDAADVAVREADAEEAREAQAVAAAAAGGVAADRENSEQRGPDGYIPRPAKNASASASSPTPATAAAAPPAGGVARLRKAISRQESQGRTSRPKMASDDEAEAAAEFRGEGDRKSEIPA